MEYNPAAISLGVMACIKVSDTIKLARNLIKRIIKYHIVSAVMIYLEVNVSKTVDPPTILLP